MSRLALILVALLCLGLGSPAHAQVYPGLKPFGAFAWTALKVNAHTSYLVSFTVLREITPETSRVELITDTSLCDTDSLHCEQVAEQTDPLPMSALKVDGLGRTAILRTRWAGTPVSITWSRRGTHLAGQLLVVSSADGLHHQTWSGGYTMMSALTSTRIFGRACRASGWLYAAAAGVAEDYTISGPSRVGRADALRNKLAATKGRCFNAQ